MAWLLLGFVLGVLASGGFLYWLDRAPEWVWRWLAK
mgnify:CR=1 FL=1